MGWIAPIIKALVVLYQTNAVFAFAVKLIAVVALNALTSKLFGPDLPKAGFTGPQVMVRSAIEYRKIVYGEALISGPIAYNNLSGVDGAVLWYWIALCEGEIDSFVEVHFGGDVIPVADITWTAGVAGADGTGNGAVTLGTYVGQNAKTAAFVAYALGHPDQVASAFFAGVSTDITSAHRMRGIAWLAVVLNYDKDTENIWKAGAPSALMAVVKGRKVYDPRLDSTQVILTTYIADKDLALHRGAVQPAELTGNEQLHLYRGAIEPAANTGADVPTTTLGSGAHRTTDSTTWAWSDDPALAIADYLLTVMGVDATEVDWESIATSADFNEELVAIPPSASPQVAFETRFTINGVVSLGDAHKDNLDKLLSSMDGTLTRAQGLWKLRPSKWEAPTIVITPDDLVGTIDLRGSAPTTERFSKIIGVFIDPFRSYELTEFFPVESSAYLTRDNGVLRKRELGLAMTNSGTMAQRIAYRMLERGNNQQVVKLQMNTRGAAIAVGEVIMADLPSLGWIDTENIALNSEDFDSWTKASLTVTEDNAEDVDGFMLADSINEPTSGNLAHELSQLLSPGVDDDTVYTLDFEVKKSNRTWVVANLTTRDGSNQMRVYFDLEAGAVGTRHAMITNVRMINLGDDWYRCAISGNLLSGSTAEKATIGVAEADNDRVFSGVNQESLLLRRASVYEGAELKPYVKTTATAITTTRKTLRVIEWMRAESGVYEITCREEVTTNFTDPLVSQYTTRTPGGVTINPEAIIAPTDLVAAVAPNGIMLTWTMPPAQGYDYIEVYESLLDNRLDSPMATLIAQTRSDSLFLARDPGHAAYYWIRGVRAPAVYSLYEPPENVSTVTATAGNTAAAAFQGGEFVYASTSPTNAKVGYRINGSTSLEEYFEGELASPAAWTSLGNFIQSGSPADVQVCLEDLGTGNVVPSGDAVDTWIDATDNPYWYVEQSASASPNVYDTFNGNIKSRNKWTQVEFATTKSVILKALESGSGLVVDASSNAINQSTSEAACYAGVEFRNDGLELANAWGSSQSFTAGRGTWLTSGAAADVWVQRVVNGSDGTGLDWLDPGSGRLQLSTSRKFGCTAPAGSPWTNDYDYVDMTFNFYDASSGGNLLDSVSYRMSAWRNSLL